MGPLAQVGLILADGVEKALPGRGVQQAVDVGPSLSPYRLRGLEQLGERAQDVGGCG